MLYNWSPKRAFRHGSMKGILAWYLWKQLFSQDHTCFIQTPGLHWITTRVFLILCFISSLFWITGLLKTSLNTETFWQYYIWMFSPLPWYLPHFYILLIFWTFLEKQYYRNRRKENKENRLHENKISTKSDPCFLLVPFAFTWLECTVLQSNCFSRVKICFNQSRRSLNET